MQDDGILGSEVQLNVDLRLDKLAETRSVRFCRDGPGQISTERKVNIMTCEHSNNYFSKAICMTCDGTTIPASRALEAWYIMQGCVAHQQVGEALTRSTINSLLPFLIPVKRASEYRPHGSEPMWRRTVNIHGFVLRGKSQREGWATAQASLVSYNNVSYMRMQLLFHRMQQVEPCRELSGVARRPS